MSKASTVCKLVSTGLVIAAGVCVYKNREAIKSAWQEAKAKVEKDLAEKEKAWKDVREATAKAYASDATKAASKAAEDTPAPAAENTATPAEAPADKSPSDNGAKATQTSVDETPAKDSGKAD